MSSMWIWPKDLSVAVVFKQKKTKLSNIYGFCYKHKWYIGCSCFYASCVLFLSAFYSEGFFIGPYRKRCSMVQDTGRNRLRISVWFYVIWYHGYFWQHSWGSKKGTKTKTQKNGTGQAASWVEDRSTVKVLSISYLLALSAECSVGLAMLELPRKLSHHLDKFSLFTVLQCVHCVLLLLDTSWYTS